MLSHDWGKDELGRDNHKRVVKIADELAKMGLLVRIDKDEMPGPGDIIDKMCRGIDKSACIAVFVTRNYVRKVRMHLLIASNV